MPDSLAFGLGISISVSPAVGGSVVSPTNILLEDNFNLLLEDGGLLILEVA